MGEAQGVAELMDGHCEEVGTATVAWETGRRAVTGGFCDSKQAEMSAGRASAWRERGPRLSSLPQHRGALSRRDGGRAARLTRRRAVAPGLLIVEVHVPGEVRPAGEEGVREGAAPAVEGVPVLVERALEGHPDIPFLPPLPAPSFLPGQLVKLERGNVVPRAEGVGQNEHHQPGVKGRGGGGRGIAVDTKREGRMTRKVAIRPGSNTVSLLDLNTFPCSRLLAWCSRANQEDQTVGLALF